MPPELVDPAGLSSRRFRAMGTEVRVVAPTDRAGATVGAVEELFAEWEQMLSRFRPESELSALNASAGRPFPAGPVLFHAVETAVSAARATGGLYDPGLLADLVRIGYDRTFDEVRSRARVGCAPPVGGGGWRRITFDRERRRITLPPGCRLDLGGIAKGMAVDASLELLDALGIEAALVSAGGDLAVRGLPPGLRSWPIAVGEDGTSVVTLVRGAVATSGTGRRSWTQDGRERHHLLDPRTGEPARSGLREVAIAASTCTQAEAAAKAVFLLGPRLGPGFAARAGVAARLVTTAGGVVTSGAWPQPLEAAA